ncbi:MAG TPA: hypothetical protein DIC42_03540 [Holosporales bacterium]|nr:hypothetical protein [Holosporales bacterium]
MFSLKLPKFISLLCVMNVSWTVFGAQPEHQGSVLPQFNVLSAYAEGVQGIVPVMLAKEIETRTEKSLVELFDVVGGAGSGSVLVAALACGMSADDVVQFFEEKSALIFSSDNKSPEGIYDYDVLKRELFGLFGNRILSTAQCVLYIVVLDRETNQPVVLSSNGLGKDRLISDVCAISMAHPSLFIATDPQYMSAANVLGNPVGAIYDYVSEQFPGRDVKLVDFSTMESLSE